MQRVHPDDRAHLRHEANRARQGAQNFDYEQRLRDAGRANQAASSARASREVRIGQGGNSRRADGRHRGQKIAGSIARCAKRARSRQPRGDAGRNKRDDCARGQSAAGGDRGQWPGLSALSSPRGAQPGQGARYRRMDRQGCQSGGRRDPARPRPPAEVGHPEDAARRQRPHPRGRGPAPARARRSAGGHAAGTWARIAVGRRGSNPASAGAHQSRHERRGSDADDRGPAAWPGDPFV